MYEEQAVACKHISDPISILGVCRIAGHSLTMKHSGIVSFSEVDSDACFNLLIQASALHIK